MPFTAAHALAVVPLVRWRRALRLDPTCLVIGSMAPDFEYFLRGELISAVSHTLRGLWLWDLPMTLVLAVLLHAVVKWPMLLIAPTAIARRAVTAVAAPWPERRAVAAALSCAFSALLGSATHLAWDSLTHANGWGPHHFHALAASLKLPWMAPLAAHRVLQYASSVVGLVVLAVVIVRWFRRAAPIVLPEVPRAAARGLVAVSVVAAAALTTGRLVLKHRIEGGDLIVGVIAGTLAGTLVASAMLGYPARRFQRAIERLPERPTERPSEPSGDRAGDRGPG